MVVTCQDHTSIPLWSNTVILGQTHHHSITPSPHPITPYKKSIKQSIKNTVEEIDVNSFYL